MAPCRHSSHEHNHLGVECGVRCMSPSFVPCAPSPPTIPSSQAPPHFSNLYPNTTQPSSKHGRHEDCGRTCCADHPAVCLAGGRGPEVQQLCEDQLCVRPTCWNLLHVSLHLRRQGRHGQKQEHVYLQGTRTCPCTEHHQACTCALHRRHHPARGHQAACAGCALRRNRPQDDEVAGASPGSLRAPQPGLGAHTCCCAGGCVGTAGGGAWLTNEETNK